MVQIEEITYQELIQTREELTKAHKVQTQENLRLKVENQWLKEQLGLAKKRLFGPSSEKSPIGQEEMLFNEAEACASPTLPDPQTETLTYTRRKTTGKRQQQLESLPIEEIDYELTQEEQVCPACEGPLHKMGVDTRQEIKIIPAQVILVKHNRAKYACRHCQNNQIKTPIVSAPMPKSAFPNSLASPSAVAYIMSQKFVLGVPLYRQEQDLLRLGFELSRQCMANWMIAGSAWLERINDRMKTKLLQSQVLHADETPLQVLKEEGRKAQTSSYMWLYRSGRDGPPIVLYDYQETRATEHPARFLKGFTGYLHVDGYEVYEKLPGVIPVGCMAHARRKFADALSVLTPIADKKGGTAAHRGLDYCNKLFAIEEDLKEATPEERYAGRLARSQSVLDEFHTWLLQMSSTVLGKCVTGKAIRYCLNQWSKLTAFMADGRLELSNNRVERAIKPFVIGRKNWLFADTPRGAEASATIYSLVETAKENGLNPMAYLTYLFDQIPNTKWTDPKALDPLLPWAEEIQANFRVRTHSNR